MVQCEISHLYNNCDVELIEHQSDIHEQALSFSADIPQLYDAILASIYDDTQKHLGSTRMHT